MKVDDVVVKREMQRTDVDLVWDKGRSVGLIRYRPGGESGPGYLIKFV